MARTHHASAANAIFNSCRRSPHAFGPLAFERVQIEFFMLLIAGRIVLVQARRPCEILWQVCLAKFALAHHAMPDRAPLLQLLALGQLIARPIGLHLSNLWCSTWEGRAVPAVG